MIYLDDDLQVWLNEMVLIKNHGRATTHHTLLKVKSKRDDEWNSFHFAIRQIFVNRKYDKYQRPSHIGTHINTSFINVCLMHEKCCDILSVQPFHEI